MENIILEHHGIKGQKWGQRRYQNKDGSLTPAGRKRYNDSAFTDAEKKRYERRDARSNAKRKTSNRASDTELAKKMMVEENAHRAIKKKHSELTAGPDRLKGSKKLAEESANTARQLKSLNDATMRNKPKQKLDLSKMSDKELRDQINRYHLEKQYNDIFAPDNVSRGRASVGQTLEVAGGVLATTASALGIALAIKELKG